MQTIQVSILFLRALQKSEHLLNVGQLIEGAIEHLELLERRYSPIKQAYILELSKEELSAWLLFKERNKNELIPGAK